jgi:diguanylate cyclase (GGDEF)-like protein/PAS domain S-box-containing protein
MDGTFDLLPDAVFCVDCRRMAFCDVNRAACESLGYTRGELLAMGPNQLCPPEHIAALARQFDDVSTGQPAAAIIRTVERRKDGQTVPVEWHVSRIGEADTERWIVVARELAAAAEFIGLGMAGHDPLTGLPDRRLFERRLDQALERMTRQDGYLFAVCFIDLDGFKAVNDSFGHLTGDRALCEIARRLTGCVRPGDVAARFGGDEFTVLVDNLRDAADATIVAQRILGRLQAPLAMDGRRIELKASIGVATSSGWSKGSYAELLHRADRAMYRAKSLGGGAMAIFEDEPPKP